MAGARALSAYASPRETAVCSKRLFIRVKPVLFEFEVHRFIQVWQSDSLNERPECCRLNSANVG
jgi:hypothetical protein